MANISRNTFEKLKHYVSVRLQQGVPLLDADWNEMEDIRRFELQAFLKWFVGDGVPAGNDGFRIQPVNGNPGAIAFYPNQDSTISIAAGSTAAPVLGFDTGKPTSKIINGSKHEPFTLANGMTLIIEIQKKGQQNPVQRTVTFESGLDFKRIEAATAIEVATVITRAVGERVVVYVADTNNFLIGGDNGTPEGAGRCLVEGWEALNEEVNLMYELQQLHQISGLAERWGIDPLPLITTPTSDRMDLVYLDIWEREVNATDDANLINEKIGIETCVRLKREWVVRVLENCAQPVVPDEKHKPGHVYYPLAQLHRLAGYASIQKNMITDLRRTGLSLAQIEDEITDARGMKATLGNRLDESLTKGGQLRWNVVGNEQIKGDAAIEEMKIRFSAAGHSHDGVYSRPIAGAIPLQNLTLSVPFPLLPDSDLKPFGGGFEMLVWDPVNGSPPSDPLYAGWAPINLPTNSKITKLSVYMFANTNNMVKVKFSVQIIEKSNPSPGRNAYLNYVFPSFEFNGTIGMKTVVFESSVSVTIKTSCSYGLRIRAYPVLETVFLAAIHLDYKSDRLF
jgi:hypothetical protein